MMNWKSWRPTWTSYSLTTRKKKTELRNAREDMATVTMTTAAMGMVTMGDSRIIMGATGEGALGATVAMGEAGVAARGEIEGALGATVAMGEAGVAARGEIEGALGATVAMGEAGRVTATVEEAKPAAVEGNTMATETRGMVDMVATGTTSMVAMGTSTVTETSMVAMGTSTVTETSMVAMGTSTVTETSMVAMGTSTVVTAMVAMGTSTVVTAMETSTEVMVTSTEVTDIVDEKYVVSFQTALRDCTITLMYACVLLEMPVY